VAPRAYWKGYLRLSLVTCPIAIFPATSEREKVSFNQINKETGHRIRQIVVPAIHRGGGDEHSHQQQETAYPRVLRQRADHGNCFCVLLLHYFCRPLLS